VAPRSRYRTDGDRTVIDVRVRNTHHLFDLRDPAPPPERDIDDRLLDYLLGAIDELPRAAKLELSVWVAEPSDDDLSETEVAEAMRAHFAWERDRFAHRLRDHLRRAQVVMLIGLVGLSGFLSLAALVRAQLPAGPVRDALHEGLLIIGWVAIWRPIESLLYDWWPLAAQRRTRTRLLEAPIVLRTGHPPSNARA
jgi:hypothetical protein